MRYSLYLDSPNFLGSIKRANKKYMKKVLFWYNPEKKQIQHIRKLTQYQLFEKIGKKQLTAHVKILFASFIWSKLTLLKSYQSINFWLREFWWWYFDHLWHWHWSLRIVFCFFKWRKLCHRRIVSIKTGK